MIANRTQLKGIILHKTFQLKVLLTVQVEKVFQEQTYCNNICTITLLFYLFY